MVEVHDATAHDYLAGRGIRTADLFTAYRIGYADGSLLQKAKGSLRDGLRRLGVIVLRHSCAIHLLENGASVRYIQALLVDLYSARARGGFLSRAVEAGIGDRIEIERDLLYLLESIEATQQEKKNAALVTPVLAMTADDRREAIELLRRPDLLDVIVGDMERIGYVGETANKKIGYLVAVSRKLDSPMSMIVMSQSEAHGACPISMMRYGGQDEQGFDSERRSSQQALRAGRLLVTRQRRRPTIEHAFDPARLMVDG